MINYMDNIKKTISKGYKERILFTEGWNSEIQKAAIQLKKENIITPILLLRNKKEINNKIKNIDHILIDDIQKDKYINLLFEIRKNKGLSIEQAKELAVQPHYLSALLLQNNDVDGVICGIEYTTRDVLRTALQVIKPRKESKIVTSVMIMQKKDNLMMFGDCSMSINPNSEELLEITRHLMNFTQQIILIKNPITALLCYSSNGSGSGEDVDKVRNAYELIQKSDKFTKQEKSNIFGEIQFDAAFNSNIRNKKVKQLKWNKSPDIYIFPNLCSGNIGYKMLEQCGGYLAVGPVISGLNKAMNDLSRGSSWKSVVEMAYITAMQARYKRSQD